MQMKVPLLKEVNSISGYMTIPAVEIFPSCGVRVQCLSKMPCIHHVVCWIISAVSVLTPEVVE